MGFEFAQLVSFKIAKVALNMIVPGIEKVLKDLKHQWPVNKDQL